MYFDTCKTPDDLYKAISEIFANPPSCVMPNHWRGNVKIGPDGIIFVGNPDWSKAGNIYADAKQRVLEFRRANPKLPLHLDIARDYRGRLQSIQEWCIDAKKPEGQGNMGTKKSPKRKKKVKLTEKKFQPWKNPGDACFIIEDNRIKFYYKEQNEDLQLRNGSNPHELLFLFAAKNPLPQVEIKKICTEKTRPSDIAKQTNTKLNEKIAAMVLPGVPKDIEFVKYNDKSKCYGLWPEIKHKDDVEYK